VTEQVNIALSERRLELVWDFTRMLTYSFKLPPMLELISSFDLRVERGQVHVGEETLRLTNQVWRRRGTAMTAS